MDDSSEEEDDEDDEEPPSSRPLTNGRVSEVAISLSRHSDSDLAEHDQLVENKRKLQQQQHQWTMVISVLFVMPFVLLLFLIKDTETI